MSYNLRHRNLVGEMLQMDVEEHLFGEPSDSDDADYEVMEESDETSSDSSLHIDPEDLQEGVRSERATSSGARGRPRSKLRGKNNYAWSTNLPVRTSGVYFHYIYFDI